jgi:hypothetical protein
VTMPSGDRVSAELAAPSDSDPGGRDAVAGALAAAMASAAGRRRDLETGTYGLGSVIGDPVALPAVVSDTSKHTGGSDARGYRRPGTAS